MNNQYKFRLIYKKFLGTVFNMHFAIHFIMKGYMLPISMMANISLLTSPDVDTEMACSIMRFTLIFGFVQTGIMIVGNVIFRYSTIITSAQAQLGKPSKKSSIEREGRGVSQKGVVPFSK